MEGSQEMERIVDKLEGMFRKAESDIEYMSRKLENEFEEAAEEKQTSPLELSRRLEQVKHDYKGILEEAENVRKAQEEMVAGVKQQLQSAAAAIQRLQQTSGAELPDVSEQEELVRSILGIPLTSASTVQSAPQSTAAQPVHHSQVRMREGAQVKQQECERQSKSSVRSEPLQITTSTSEPVEDEENVSPIDTTFEISPSPAELRAQSDDIVPVTEEEFASVSDLIRGRAKLDDINRVYRRLYDHFRTEGNKGSLSVPDMSKMGMRITGATGEAKLKACIDLFYQPPFFPVIS
ncbi:SKA complex subunit 2-like [Diadema antillarum]|uniref:SKA complex subunit 2-like n=1 Tax=Diadema antillarum TaxID=105358 RepID=UPI003A870556